MSWTGGFGNVRHASTPPPSPGVTTDIDLRTYCDDVEVDRCTLAWHGYTADEVIRERVRRWKDAGSKFERNGNVLTHWNGDGIKQVLTVGGDAS